MTTATDVAQIPAINRTEAVALATAELERVTELFRQLGPDDWTRPTECPGWDVRAMAAHMVGMMEGFSSFRSLAHLMRQGKKQAGGGKLVDGMTALQVAERAHLSADELVAQSAELGPRQARWRGSRPGLMRRAPMQEEVGGTPETWKLGYLFDVILTRDPWMHRVDISRATGHPMVLTAEHDGRLVADVVAEWARRHGQPFELHLGGPAGGEYTQGEGGEVISIDAVEFCRTISGRATGTGLLNQEVPF
jgi:uncharacterized protein (TIGR03083 family)